MDVSIQRKERKSNKKEKNNEVKVTVGNNVSPPPYYLFGEFSLKYGKEIDKREFPPIWKLTDYEGK